MKNLKQRNYTIDFLRGCACICVILIHTAWWSGSTYLPKWVSNLFLIADVPIFIFISGLSYNYVNSIGKNIRGILSQWNKWIFFLIFYLTIILLFFRPEFNRTQLIKYVFYGVPSNGALQVVGGSLWFVSMYIKVTIFCDIILFFYNKNHDTIKFEHLLMLLLFFSVFTIAFLDTYITIYSFIYLLGYYSSNYKIKSFKQLLLFEILSVFIIILIFWISGYSIIDIQNLKFPPTIYYLLVSIPSILIVWYLKDRLKITNKNPMNYLGKNAIFFYYSQGISSSILYFILYKLSINNLYIKFILLAILNTIMSILFGIIICVLYNFFIKLIAKVKPYIYKILLLEKIN